MVINAKKTMICFFHVVNILFSFLLLQNISDFHLACVLGTVFVFITLFLNVIFEWKILSPSFVLLFCFVLFQFGLPILYAIDSSYENWYIQQFDIAFLVSSIKVSVSCIQFFALGLVISSRRMANSYFKQSYIFSDGNSDSIYRLSKKVFYVTAVIAFPLALYVAYLASLYGYSYIKDDNMHIYNGFTRFAQQMIVPANLLLIIYSKTKKQKNKWVLTMMVYSILLILTGARTTSLAIFLTLLLMKREEERKKVSFVKDILTIMAIFLVLFLGVFIAKYRYDGTIVSFSILNTAESVVEEMGFNFTSLPFTKLFVPSMVNYQYGLSYLYSIICIIPRALDPIGFIDHLHEILPETWLANNLSFYYGSLYDFGVGYSVIAEAYYNFSNFAFISTFIQGMIISLFINNYGDTSKFSKYIKFIMLFSLLTYPRRSFITLLKSIEYCVVLVIILIFFYSKRKEKSNYENNDNMS